MGIPELAAKHALYKSGNNSADMAVTWYFENMSDPSLNEPLRVKKEGGSSNQAAGAGDVPQDMVDMMMAMGLPEKKCKSALKKCDLNVERAIEYVFSHMDDPDSEIEEDSVMDDGIDHDAQYLSTKPGNYKLQSFITHLGASVHAGHYVCHI